MDSVDKLSEIGAVLETYIKDANSGTNFSLSVHDVWFNIDSSVPRTPAILIEPQNVEREMQSTGFTTINTFLVHFTILHSRLGSESDTNQECLTIAEDLEEVLHANRRLGGELIHSIVSSTTLGVASRQKTTLRAARLVWQGFNKTKLPPL